MVLAFCVVSEQCASATYTSVSLGKLLNFAKSQFLFFFLETKIVTDLYLFKNTKKKILMCMTINPAYNWNFFYIFCAFK